MRGVYLNNISKEILSDSKCMACLDYTVNKLRSGILTDIGIKGADLIDEGFRQQILQLVDAGVLNQTMIDKHTRTARPGMYYALTDNAWEIYHLAHDFIQS